MNKWCTNFHFNPFSGASARYAKYYGLVTSFQVSYLVIQLDFSQEHTQVIADLML